jgi:hypothetical protein
LLAQDSGQRQVKIEVEAKRAVTVVCLPENRLRQILFNLVQNAIEASPEGGLVRISVGVDQQCLTISLIDQGNGIPDELRPHIFEPFFTTKSNAKTGGLGLGLSVCKSLVEGMNGSISFENRSDRGAEFRVVLPLAQRKIGA